MQCGLSGYLITAVLHCVQPSLPNAPISSFIQFSIYFIFSTAICLKDFTLPEICHTTKSEGFEGQVSRNLAS